MSDKLEKFLLRSGLITKQQLAAAKADAAKTKKRLPESLMDLGFIEEREFAQVVAVASGAPVVDPLPEDDAGAIAHRISRAIARDLEVVPIKVEGEELHVALVNPLDVSAIDVLNATTGFRVRPLTGIRSAVERLVNKLYPEDYATDITLLPPPGFGAPSSRDVVPGDSEEPFDFSNETLIGSLRKSPFANAEFGTVISTPAGGSPGRRAPAGPSPRTDIGDISTNPTNPFIAIERRFDQLAKLIARIDKRLDAIEAALTHTTRR